MRCLGLFVITSYLTQLGASRTCGGSEPISISSQDDLDFVADCDTIIGGVEIAPNMTGDLTLVNSNDIPMLIGGRLSIKNTSITSFSAPNLDNGNLHILNFSSLHSVYGDLVVASNLVRQLHFPGMEIISQDVNLTGSFTRITFGPYLQEINGGFTAWSTEDLDYAPLDTLNDDGLIQGSYSCTSWDDLAASWSSLLPTPTADDSSISDTTTYDSTDGDRSSGSGFDQNARIGLGWAFHEDEKEDGKLEQEQRKQSTIHGGPVEVEDTDRYVHEMGADTGVSEMPSGKSAVAAELDSRGGISELPAREGIARSDSG
ncbi:hypothetical protein BJY01DRAFT_245599 [Aspergillus pseudoustus]|uniref:Receptor L-domain domain-containing protein n=1 Tax=Aspergillus pseudoustus TaxID=1810923 RepID=A0ABR4KCX2_9EURO